MVILQYTLCLAQSKIKSLVAQKGWFKMSKFRDLLKVGLALALCFCFAWVGDVAFAEQFCTTNSCIERTDAYKKAVKRTLMEEYKKKVYDRNCEINSFCPPDEVRVANKKNLKDSLEKEEQLRSSLLRDCFSEKRVEEIRAEAVSEFKASNYDAEFVEVYIQHIHRHPPLQNK
jgi:hypothetical protein